VTPIWTYVLCLDSLLDYYYTDVMYIRIIFFFCKFIWSLLMMLEAWHNEGKKYKKPNRISQSLTVCSHESKVLKARSGWRFNLSHHHNGFRFCLHKTPPYPFCLKHNLIYLIFDHDFLFFLCLFFIVFLFIIHIACNKSAWGPLKYCCTIGC
jgi:hypothetical protein